MALTHKRSEVDAANAGGRIDRVVQELTGKARREIRGLFDHECVKLNGKTVTAVNQPVAAGDVVEVAFDAHTRYHEKPRPRKDSRFRVVFEDEHLVVVNKAAWVLTVPGEEGGTNTLVHALQEYVTQGRKNRRVEVIHRLDQGVSGLLVFAKNEEVAATLQLQFATHKPKREYLALVKGIPEPPEGTFESELVTDRNLTRRSARPHEEGERAVTHYRVEQMGRDTCLVRAWLETGKRNQIRVHFAEAGHPVLGDKRYEPKRARHPRWTARRLALHAAVLGFVHPVSGEKLEFEAPLPAEFRNFMR